MNKKTDNTNNRNPSSYYRGSVSDIVHNSIKKAEITKNHQSKGSPNPDRIPCMIPPDQIVKKWTTWTNLGWMPCPVQHIITDDKEEYTKICTVVWCNIQDTTGRSSMCPPEWWSKWNSPCSNKSDNKN